MALRTVVALSLLSACAVADFIPCPLLGPWSPKPTGIAASGAFKDALQKLTADLDQGVTTSNTSYGPITPNTTSFSLVLFDATKDAPSSDPPFFWEYHHTAPTLISVNSNAVNVTADSIFRIGELTEVFTAWTVLASVGDTHWNDPVTQWVPELAAASPQQDYDEQTAVDVVDWDSITLGDLASHLAGLQRSSRGNSSRLVPGEDRSCAYDRRSLLDIFAVQPPAFPAAATPLKSLAGFQILAYALEGITGRPLAFTDLLHEKILGPMNMTCTTLALPSGSLEQIRTQDDSTSLWNLDLGDQAYSAGMYSTTADLARAGRAILSSTLLRPSVTNRWLKPRTHTSNVVNSVGMPWEIYTAATEITDHVVDAYTARGNFGLYSSYFGVVPDYDIGFAILAADAEKNADLNAYSDTVAGVIPALEIVAQSQAEQSFTGVYTDANGVVVNITTTDPRVPGLSVDVLKTPEMDIRMDIAKSLDIAPDALSFRLYPTGLRQTAGERERLAFRAIFEDINALVDAGTPTCETWRTANQLFIDGVPADRFVFDTDGITGKAATVEVPFLQATLERQ